MSRKDDDHWSRDSLTRRQKAAGGNDMNTTDFETLYKEVTSLEAKLKTIDNEERRRHYGQMRHNGEVTEAEMEYIRKRMTLSRNINSLKEDKAFARYYRRRKLAEIKTTISDIRKSYR